MASGVKHHFDDAFDVAVCGLEGSDIHAKPPGDRGPDLRGVEFLALDFTALEDIFCQCLKDGLLAEVKSKGFHVADQPALLVADRSEGLGEPFPVPVKPGPVFSLIDEHSPHLLRRL
jgi:hypothetical protein